jgi:hypothetical protein
MREARQLTDYHPHYRAGARYGILTIAMDAGITAARRPNNHRGNLSRDTQLQSWHRTPFHLHLALARIARAQSNETCPRAAGKKMNEAIVAAPDLP